MVSFYKPVKKEVDKTAFEVTCTGLDLLGRGIARAQNTVWFIKGLMPGENARISPLSQKGRTGEARMTKLITPSAQRRRPDCPYQEQCGGCQLQHLPPAMALEAKVQGIEQLMEKSCNLKLPPISFKVSSPETAYRRACRLAVRTDHGRVELGFRGEKSRDLVPVAECRVLTSRINQHIGLIAAAINRLEAKKKVGHVEFIDSDGSLGVLLRFTAEISDKDREKLTVLAREHQLVLSVVEPYKHYIDGSDQLRETVLANAEKLVFKAGEFELNCKPSAFVQVNREVNRELIARVLGAVQPESGGTYLDLFCGFGNFAMAMAPSGGRIHGIDIVKEMIDVAAANARRCGADNVSFHIADLESDFDKQLWARERYDAVVMDPGRQGAKRASVFLSRAKPRQIVMISCNPLAASRDLSTLIRGGYRLERWGVLDMFPRTQHVELMLELSLAEE